MTASLFEQHKAMFARQLRHHVSLRGRAETGVVIEAAFSAVADFLRNTQGQRVAYETFARHADAVLTPGLPASDPSDIRSPKR